MYKLIETKENTMKTLISFDSASGKFIGTVDGKVVVRSKYESAVKARLAEMSGTIADAQKAFEEKSEKFDINTRFGFFFECFLLVVNLAKRCRRCRYVS